MAPTRWASLAWDRLLVADPQRENLLRAGRVTLSVGLGVLGVVALAHWTSMPSVVATGGVLLSLMASLSLQDPDPVASRGTLLAWLPVGAVAVTVGSLVPTSGLGSSLAFLGAIGVAVLVRRWSTRGTSLGMAGFFAYFATQAADVRLPQLGWMLGALAVSTAMLALVRFVLLADRPERVERWVLDAYRRALAGLVGSLAVATERGVPTVREGEELRRALRRLNEAAIVVEATLGADDARPFGAELAAEQSFGVLVSLLIQGHLGEGERRTLAERLWVVRDMVRSGTTPHPRHDVVAGETIPALREALTALEQAPLWQIAAGGCRELPDGTRTGDCPPATPRPDGTARPGSVRAEQVAVMLAGAGEKVMEAAGQPVEEVAPAVDEAAASEGLSASSRQAIQAVVACGLAMVVGRWLSAERWTWAVIAAFVVFSQATTRGESLRRAWHRIVGTVLGALAGLVVSRGVHAHLGLEMAAVFGSLFVGVYLTRVSYAWMVGATSLMIAVVYDLLGRLTPGLLVLRVDETLAGATIGGLVAVLVLPSRTMTRIREASAALLRGVEEFLEHVATSGQAPEELAREVRRLDALLVSLRTASLPLTSGPVAIDPVVRRLVEASEGLVFLVRQFAGATGIDPERRAAAAQLARRANLTARLLDGTASAPDGSTAEALPTTTPTAAMRWLGRIDEALDEIDETTRTLRGSTPTTEPLKETT